MIPSVLKMRNFMCYRDDVPALNFDGIHVACLCGSNGSGKSTVFDAITWALWGKASRGRNDDIISLGQHDMEVELEFYIAGKRYRIVRKYTRSAGSRSGQVMLDLQISNDGRYHSIAEHIVKDTQEKITRLLHLDYQTFINSAMLLQGKANEFSIKIPSERKDILARILDLSTYDELEEDAKAEAEKNKLEYINLERYIATIDMRINARPQHEEALEKAAVELGSIEQAAGKVENDLQELRRHKERLAARDEQLKLIEKQIADRVVEMKAVKEKLDISEQNLDRYHKAIAGKEDIEKGYLMFQKLVEKEQEENIRLRQFHDLSQRKNNLEALITSTLNALSGERKVLSIRVAELENRCSRLPILENKKMELEKKQEMLAGAEADILSKQKLVKDIAGVISSVSAINSQLQTASEEIRRKMAMISHASAVCPLCERALGPDEHRRISQKLELELQQYTLRSKENNLKLSQNKNELVRLEKEIREKEAAFRSERDAVNHQTTLTTREISEIEKALAEIDEKKPRLELLDRQIRERDFTPNEQRALTEIEDKLKALGYDPAVHERITRDKNAAAIYDRLFRELNEAHLRMESEEKSAADSRSALSRMEETIVSLTREKDNLKLELAGLSGIDEQLLAMEEKRRSIITADRNAREQIAKLRENIRQIDELVIEKNEKTRLLQNYREAESIYAELARYLGKKGVQALIIEESLPEITNEANDLLGRMTDNRMSVTLESQKETRKGETVETLDIKVSDELGTRSYEMYSGGEAFRIDLALRIAISRLLVRRAGASMPILIIDEGFGTQDADSLEKLINAINYIQDDFEKIFIITHLEELRDKFPVIININKTGEGSVITVSQ